MQTCLIREETNQDNYYIHLEESNNTIKAVHTKQNIIEELSLNDIKKLLKTILSSKLTYKERYNEYDVYLDEANNKRYFKNGIENLLMFFENNGISAIDSIEKIDKKENKEAKRIKIKVGPLTFIVLMEMIMLIPLSGDIQQQKAEEKVLSYFIDVSDEEMNFLINTSFHLSREEKEYICNSRYFDFVLDNSNNTRNYELRTKLNNINVRFYEEKEKPGTDGYYAPTRINTINILEGCDQDEEWYKDTFTHEFIHITQSNNEFCYIREASDEIFKNEFYNLPLTDYPDLIIRVKALMEIIGPEPIIDCNFNDYPTKFKEAIKKYLPDEEANELLELFTNREIYNPESQIEINEKVDKLLSIMYYNKTGKDMDNDVMIRLIYTNNANDRVYFNTESMKYNDSFSLNWDSEEIDKLDLDDVINSESVKCYNYNREEIKTNNDVKNYIYTREKTLDFSSIPINEVSTTTVTIEFKDGTLGFAQYDKKNGEWSKVKHYRSIERFEPSIPGKFPDQVHNRINIKEFPKKEESEAKLI